eukprot:m.56575 g.56575  ORF g.56575 m.56575 type:complete len:441 (+) comp11046_c0_seq1:277-1599(+)
MESTRVEGGQYQATPVCGNAVPENLKQSKKPLIKENVSRGFPIEADNEKVSEIMRNYEKTMQERTEMHLGYPYNLDFEYQELVKLQSYSINNLGDPWLESNYGVHAREFEIGVLDWFAKLWHIDSNSYWGYITNCGTEGNLHGILVAREVHPEGVLYCSSETHYSVPKAARMYRMPFAEVETQVTGEMNLTHFRELLRKNTDKPAIVCANIGTTVKGAVDDLDGILDVLREEGFTEDRFYIHCDGALFGIMAPFLDRKLGENALVTFEKPIGSVSVSGHKFLGTPMPCGVIITRMEHIQALSNDVEYLNSRDATIMGSRNGHAAIFMWYNLCKKGLEGLYKDVQKCMINAKKLKQLLTDKDIPCMLNELSSTVVFERPREGAFIRKWQLACKDGMAHVVVMPSVELSKLKRFVDELLISREKVGAAGPTDIVEGLEHCRV